MGKIDEEMDAVEKALASEDATEVSIVNSSAWRIGRTIGYWLVVAAIIGASLLLIGACNFVESMKETHAQAEAAAAALEKEMGTRPFMGWNVHNGTLTNLNVIFEGSKVAALPVSELEAKVRRAVAASFKQQPKQLLVSARWEQ